MKAMLTILSLSLLTQLAACGGAQDAADSYCEYWGEKAVTCGFLDATEVNPDSCADAVRAWGQSEEYIQGTQAELANMTCDEWAARIMGGE